MTEILSVSDLTKLGRVRLSPNFFMRDMLYSEVANFHGMANIPDDPDLAIEVGRRLCEEILEPLKETFGHINIRSAFRSSKVNGFCNECYVASEGKNTAYYCSDNDYGAARHIWDVRDGEGYLGATASVVIPWYLPMYEQSKDPMPLGWWIKDHIESYSELIFYPWLCAFNIRWYEGPSAKAIIHDDGKEEILVTDNTMESYHEDRSAQYAGFPAIP
jgi:hypothetical protein